MNEVVQPKVLKVVVYHRGYGCDTGCCGHAVRLSEDDEYNDFGFDLDHPWSAAETDAARKEWAVAFATSAVIKEYGSDHVADLDWDECVVTTNC